MGFVSVVKLAFYFYDAYLHNEFYNQSVISAEIKIASFIKRKNGDIERT